MFIVLVLLLLIVFIYKLKTIYNQLVSLIKVILRVLLAALVYIHSTLYIRIQTNIFLPD